MKYGELVNMLEVAAKKAMRRAVDTDDIMDVEVGMDIDRESYVQPVGGVRVCGTNLIAIYQGPHYSGK